MTVLYFEVIINTIVYKVFIIAGIGLEKFDCSSAGGSMGGGGGGGGLYLHLGVSSYIVQSVDQSQTTIFVATNVTC